MSAFGMFAMDLGLEYARSVARRQNKLDFAEINELYAGMARRAREDFERIGIAESRLSYKRTVEMRYVGQYHEVEIDLPAGELSEQHLASLLQAFHTRYEALYTYSMPWRAVEFLNYRLKVTSPSRPLKSAPLARASGNVEAARRGSRLCLFDDHAGKVDTPVYDWDRLQPGHTFAGPALIDDKTTTVLLVRGFGCEVDDYHNLVMRPA
jgi:N-methylhydantoinase A